MEGSNERIIRIYNPNLRTVETYRSTAQYATLGSGRLADISITLPSLEWEHLRIDFDSHKVTAIGSGVSVDGQQVLQGSEIKLTNDSIVRVYSIVLGIYDNSKNAAHYISRILQEGRKNPRTIPSLEISHCRCIIEDVPEGGDEQHLGPAGAGSMAGPATTGVPQPSPFTNSIPGPGSAAGNVNAPARPPITNSVIGSNPITSNVVVERASFTGAASPNSAGLGGIQDNIDSEFSSQTADNAGYIRQSYTRIVGDIAGIGVIEGQGVPGIGTNEDRDYKRIKLSDGEVNGAMVGADGGAVGGTDGALSIAKQLIDDTKKEILSELKVEPKDDLVKAFIDKKIEGIKHEIDEEVNGQGDIAVKRRKSVDLGKVAIEKDLLEEARREVKDSVEDMDDFKRTISDNIKEEVRETMNEIVQSEVKESIGSAVAECLNDSNIVSAIADSVKGRVEEADGVSGNGSVEAGGMIDGAERAGEPLDGDVEADGKTEAGDGQAGKTKEDGEGRAGEDGKRTTQERKKNESADRPEKGKDKAAGKEEAGAQKTADKQGKEERPTAAKEGPASDNAKRKTATPASPAKQAEKEKAKKTEEPKKEKAPALRRDSKLPSGGPIKEVVTDEEESGKEGEPEAKQAGKEKGSPGHGKKGTAQRGEGESAANKKPTSARPARKAASARQTAAKEEQPDHAKETPGEAAAGKDTPEGGEAPVQKRGRGRPRKDTSKANK